MRGFNVVCRICADAVVVVAGLFFFFSSRRRHTRCSRDWSSDVCSSDLALIQVPGLEGVRGFLNNQEIGRTNGSGNLLVPSLQPYYGNRLRIGDADIPIDYQIGAVEQVVATTVRGGALVPFDVQRVTSVKGMVRVDLNGHPTVPAFGELRLDSRLKSPLGADGQFWFEDLGVGTHLAEVEFREGTCRFELVVPKDPGTSLNLGTVSCSAGQVAILEYLG